MGKARIERPFPIGDALAMRPPYEKVRKIIAENLEIDENTITPESVITDDLGADSLDVVDLVMSFEDEFGVEIPDEAVETIRTVGDIVKYIEDNQ